MSQDGQVLAVRTHTYVSKVVVQSPSGQKMIDLDVEQVTVPAVAISPDGRLMACNGGPNRVRIYSIETGELLGQLNGHDTEVQVLEFTPDGRFLASGSYDGTVKLWALPLPFLKHSVGSTPTQASATK